jgi:serine/threonine-protein phosphatase CPPED1
MCFRQKARVPTLSLVIAVFIGLCFQGICKTSALAAEDPGLLRNSASGQSYEDLIRSVQSRPVSREGLVFVVLGDSRGDMTTSRKIYARAAMEKPAFILHTGDMVNEGTVEEYLHYHLALVKEIAPIPVIPVPGNHEARPSNDFVGFRAIYGAERFSFDCDDGRFVGVNNSGSERLTESDLQFLERELSKPGVKHKFVVMHVPAHLVQQYGKPKMTKKRGFTQNAEAFHALMVRQGVRGVFFGHDHGFAYRLIDGVPYMITGGAGAELYFKYNWLEQFHHYLVVRVTPKGVTRELVRLDGDRWVRSQIGDGRQAK